MNNIIDKYLDKNVNYTFEQYLKFSQIPEVIKYIKERVNNINYLEFDKINFENFHEKRLLKIYYILHSKEYIITKYDLLNNSNEEQTLDILYSIKKYRFVYIKFMDKIINQYYKNKNDKLKDIIIFSNQFIIADYILSLTNDTNIIFDLIQEGNLGLVKALSKYNTSSDLPFHYYAYWYVRKYIDTYFILNNKFTIKTPKNICVSNEIYDYIDEYKIKYLKEPSIDEITNKFNITKERYINLVNSEDIISLNEKIDEEDELIDYISCKENYVFDVDDIYFLKFIINELEKKFSKNRLDVFKKRLGILEEEKNFVEIGKELNVTKQAADQKYMRILKKIQSDDDLIKLFKY